MHLLKKSVFLALLQAVLHAFAKDAVFVEGIANYETFSRGKRNLFVTESISAIALNEKWFVTTRFLSSEPTLQRPELFCPPSQAAGSDGDDSYYLKDIPNKSPQQVVAWVEPGSVPNMAQSPSVCITWLALVSGSYLAQQQRDDLRPIWIVAANKNRQEKCPVHVSYQRNSRNPAWLDILNFHSDGRVDPCNPSRDGNNLRAPPWNDGFTQAVFRVESFTPLADNVSPANCVFELFTPARQTTNHSLNVLSRIRLQITNVMVSTPPNSWLPTLPRERIIVQDYRFTETVTNWQSVAYPVTNKWAERNDASVSNAIALGQRPSPNRATEQKQQFVKWAVALIACIPLAGLVIWWTTKKQRKEKR